MNCEAFRHRRFLTDIDLRNSALQNSAMRVKTVGNVMLPTLATHFLFGVTVDRSVVVSIERYSLFENHELLNIKLGELIGGGSEIDTQFRITIGNGRKTRKSDIRHSGSTRKLSKFISKERKYLGKV